MLDLMRRYAYGFVNSHDFSVPEQIMRPDYRLHVGTETLVGRDERYLPAVRHQLTNYPSLTYSIHELITDGERTAVLFSEHGRSRKEPRTDASWIGVGIYRVDGERLAECWVEQDHYGKRRQLATGASDPVPVVAADPWAGHEAASPRASRTAEPVVRSWLAGIDSWPPTDSDLDAGGAQGEQPCIRVEDAHVETVVAEGDRVGFYARVRGAYQGGLAGLDHTIGTPVETWVGAFADVDGRRLHRLRGATNRLAVARQLSASLSSTEGAA